MKRVVCPVCGKKNDNGNKIFNRDFSGMKEIVPYTKYTVFECNGCGMVYAGNVEESMPLDEYYNVMSKYEGSFKTASVINDLYERIADFLEQYVNKTARILDVGCAFGGLLNVLKSRGYENLSGLEPSKKNCNYAMEHYGIKVYHGALGYNNQFVHEGGTSVDLIILSAVLEHIDDIKVTLQEAKKLLSSNGMICIIVPDADLFCDNVDLYQEFSTEHINYFNSDSLKQLFMRLKMKYVSEHHDRVCLHGLAGNVMMLWQLDNKDKMVSEPVLLNGKIRQYISQCADFAEEIKIKVSHEKMENGVYIWCAGTMTAMLYQLGIISPSVVREIVDSNLNYQGHEIFGHIVKSPEVLKSMPELPIIIASQYAENVIRKQIDIWGLKNRVISLFDEK